MRRTAFLRKPADVSTLTVKLKKCKAPGCQKEYVPRSSWQKACSVECVLRLSKAEQAKAAAEAAKVDRAQTREAKRALEKTSVKEKRLEKVVNEIARVRDHEDGCISCDKPAHWDGAWHGSHYKSVGSNSALRFNLWNIHKACSDCNWHRGGNIAQYVPRLRQKLGQERLDWLDNHPRSREYDRDYLDRAYVVATQYLKRLRKRKGL